MFQDALFESAGRQRRSRPATLAAYVLQSIAVASIVIAPLLHIAPPPQVRSIIESLSFSPPPPAPAIAGTRASQTGFSQLSGIRVIQPRVIPLHPAVVNDANVQPPSIAGTREGVVGGTGAAAGNQISELLSRSTAMPVRPPDTTRPVPVSTGVMQGLLLTNVRPVYPPLAQAAHIQGAVVLIATISVEGVIENIRVVSGHPMLVGAAIDAVRQWRYRPYLLNKKPIEVETQITVNFVTSGG